MSLLKKLIHKKRAVLVALLFLLPLEFTALAEVSASSFTKQERLFLSELYGKSQLDKTFVQSIFFDKRLKKFPIVVTKNVHNKEYRRNYEDFHSPYSFMIASRFQKKWKTVLKKASDQFNVDQEVLVAILLVETGLGNVLGRYPVISVFSSILVEHDRKQTIFENKSYLTDDELYELSRLQQKAEWAFTELKALLVISKDTGQNPFQLKGSFAGAFGIPQFLPSSYLKWGFDSDKNGSVNLFLVPDAVYSTANYLKAHGWKKGLYRESNKDVIYKYNKSDIYVETVLSIARKIQASLKPESKDSAEQTRLNRTEISRERQSTS